MTERFSISPASFINPSKGVRNCSSGSPVIEVENFAWIDSAKAVRAASSFELRASSFELRASSFELRASSFELIIVIGHLIKFYLFVCYIFHASLLLVQELNAQFLQYSKRDR